MKRGAPKSEFPAIFGWCETLGKENSFFFQIKGQVLFKGEIITKKGKVI
jgi:hypothetical protein